MRIHSDEEIIGKAYLKIKDEGQINTNTVDITVDFEDEHEVTHSYVVSFKKGTESGAPEWTPLEITEISSL